jgi:hypothetical protein
LRHFVITEAVQEKGDAVTIYMKRLRKTVVCVRFAIGFPFVVLGVILVWIGWAIADGPIRNL